MGFLLLSSAKFVVRSKIDLSIIPEKNIIVSESTKLGEEDKRMPYCAS